MKTKYFYPVLLIIISVIVCIQNYKFGTYLSGWDTLHPEFNFSEYFNRILSVWQEHQGLGAVAAQAHASELPRVILMFFLSWFLPQNFLRYSYFFLTLIIGPLGVFFFAKEFLKPHLAFLSGLLFLLNLTTVQQYSVPLEMFATLYGFIGWLFLFAVKFITNPQRKYLWLFILVTILSIPMAHTPTLFYVFFLLFSFFLFNFAFLLKKTRSALTLILIMLSLNSFWILPNIYFISVYGNSVANSKIHSQFSDRAFQVGKNFGDFEDAAILKNFLFDWGEYNNFDGSFIYLLKPWSKHLSFWFVKFLGQIIFLMVIFGLGVSVKRKDKIGLSLLPVFLLSYFFVANDNFLFEKLAQFLGSYFITLKEALRFPFTKFSIILLFCYCFYFVSAFSFFKKNLTFLIALLLVFYMWPIFTGNLINSKMRVNTPKYYFDVFNYFKSIPQDGRIALFPVHTFWGWNYHNWGYEGAGFLWFGLKQPLLTREFDRWHPANEGFYWEASYATYHEDLELLESVLEKYQVKYLLLDFSITDASSAKSPYLDQLKKLLAKSKKIKPGKIFGKLSIYQLDNISENFLAEGSFPKIGPVFLWTDIDTAYSKYGQYIFSDYPQVYYPFRSLFTNHTNQKMDFELQEKTNSFLFLKKIPKEIKSYKLTIPDKGNLVWFDDKNLDFTGSFLPKVTYNGQELVVEIPKDKGYFSKEINPNIKLAKNCDFLRLSQNPWAGEVKNEAINDKLVRFSSKLANNCSGEFNLHNLSHLQSYLITFYTRNIQNKTLLFWLENTSIRKSDLEVYLPQTEKLTKFYFIQPPLDPYGTGYTLHFDNWSFNKSYSVNDLGVISVYPIPYFFLANITLENKAPTPAKLDPVQSLHPLPYLYIAKTSGKEKNLVLYQSYDPGWYAFGASDHFLVNNWANGWKVNKEGTVVIFFLPQLLEFAGFAIFGSMLFYLRKHH